MKSIFLLLLAALFSNAVYGKFQKALNFEKLIQFATKLVKELEVSGIESYIPSKEEAQENLKELGRIKYISKIKDKKKRNRLWAQNPNLKIMKFRLRLLAQISKISLEQQEQIIDSHEDLLKTTVKLSMLDTKNKKSPVYGKDLKKLMNQDVKQYFEAKKKAAIAAKKKNNPDSSEKKANTIKPKYNRKDDVMKLMFSEVIAPGNKRLPDSNKLVFKDKMGRTCYCSC